MVLPSGAGLHPGRDVDGEGSQRANHLGHRVGTEAARHEQAGGGQSGRPSGVERAAAGVTWRGLAGWKLSPTKSAPAAMAARASSSVHTPQILTLTDTGATPRGPRPGRAPP